MLFCFKKDREIINDYERINLALFSHGRSKMNLHLRFNREYKTREKEKKKKEKKLDEKGKEKIGSKAKKTYFFAYFFQIKKREKNASENE